MYLYRLMTRNSEISFSIQMLKAVGMVMLTIMGTRQYTCIYMYIYVCMADNNVLPSPYGYACY